jgi:hypothetical protein
MNDKEEFYIKKVIYPTVKQDKEIQATQKEIKKENTISGKLIEPCRVKYTRKGGAIKKIGAGEAISYNRFTKEIVEPKKYRKKGAILLCEPVFEKELKLTQELKKDDGEIYVTLTIDSNFKIDSVTYRIEGENTFDAMELKPVKANRAGRYRYSTVPIVFDETTSYTVKVVNKKFQRIYKCSIKNGCEAAKKVKL